MPLSFLEGVARRPVPDGAPGLRCAFVNNMPDAAFVATERQFLRLLELGSRPARVVVSRHVIAGAARSAPVTERIAAHYLPLDALWGAAPDLVVVTGAEPLAPRLPDEPSWAELVRLLEWVTSLRTTVVLSCLAAHGAALALDGIERVRLADKCCGILPHTICSPHRLTQGLVEPIIFPHSHLNEVPTRDLRAAGYTVAVAAEKDWCVAAKRHGCADIVLAQGHPEYDASSLLREYRRDLTRFVEGTASEPPVLPRGCAAPADMRMLERLQSLATSGAGRDRLVEELQAVPFERLSARVPWSWRPAAIRLYCNVLATAVERAGVR